MRETLELNGLIHAGRKEKENQIYKTAAFQQLAFSTRESKNERNRVSFQILCPTVY